MRWGSVLLATSLAGVWCGGGCAGSATKEGGSVLGNNFACDIGTDANHTCVVWSWSGDNQSNADWRRYCDQMGGMPRRGCDVKMAVAGCASTSSGGNATNITTWWYYMGDAAELKMQCERSG